MSTYKLLLLDLDGTTVASNGKAMPSERVVSAVKQAQQHIQIAVATGRPKAFAWPVIEALDLHGLGVFNGGAEIIDTVSGEILHKQLLSIESMREVVEVIQAFGVNVYDDTRQYDLAITSPDQIEQETAKLFVGNISTQDAMHLISELGAVKGISAHPTTSWSDGDVVDIHITHERATKRYGVERLMQILDIKKEEVIAIGDGYNDLPMLEAAGFKVAMGNAPDEIKAAADHVAPSLEDDGVADTIEKFVLGDK